MSITYPVDLENTRWSLVRISDSVIVRHNKPWPRADGEEIVGLDTDLVPLLEVQEAQPVFDPATDRLGRTAAVIDILNNTHTHGWEIIPLTQDELDAAAEREQAKALYSVLKDHSGTPEERRTRLENGLAYVIKDLYGAS
jgi:hypothetical protein